MASKADDKDKAYIGQQGANPPPHAGGGTPGTLSAAATDDGGTPGTTNALSAVELQASLHHEPQDQLASVAAAAATTNASNDKWGAGEDARRLADSAGTNEGGNALVVTPRKEEEAPPTMDTKTNGDANSERTNWMNDKGKGRNPPVYDDVIFAERGRDIESGLDINDCHSETQPMPVDVDDGNDGPPLIGRATAGSSPPANVAAARCLAPANADGDADNLTNAARRPGAGMDLINYLDRPVPTSTTLANFDDEDILSKKAAKSTNAATHPGAKVEYIEGMSGPDLASTMLANTLSDVDITSEKAAIQTNAATRPGTGMDLINYIDRPVPTSTTLSNFIDEDILSKKAALSPFNVAEFDDRDQMRNMQHWPREDSLVIPTREEIEDEDEWVLNNRGYINGANANAANLDAHYTENEEVTVKPVNNPESFTLVNDDLEAGSTFHMPLAQLVSDEVIEATRVDPVDPPLLWYEQKQVKCFFVLFLVLLAVAVSAFVVRLPSNDAAAVATNTGTGMIESAISNAPSSSIVPGLLPSNDPAAIAINTSTVMISSAISNAPSSSIVPSFLPSNDTAAIATNTSTVMIASTISNAPSSSIVPSLLPSTTHPSVMPTGPPLVSIKPTTPPSAFPSVTPTGPPYVSIKPTTPPSASPSVRPTGAPYVSIKPTTPPSASPSVRPTGAPYVSIKPTTPPSASPSVRPTGAPYVSIKPTTPPSDEPSPKPSACVAKISSNARKIDLLADDPHWPWAEVDGNNMVVAVMDGSDGPVFVIFHSLANDGWQRVNTFRHDDLGSLPSIAISGKTVFVGFPYANNDAGAVLVYEQNLFGQWEEVEDPFIHDVNASRSYFGYRVGIGGNLAFVADWDDHVYIFRRESGKWMEFDRIDDEANDASITGDVTVSISGDVIAVASWNVHLYKYIPDLNKVISIQDPISTGWVRSMDLSDNYLVYWDHNEGDAFIYRREATNQKFVFYQQLNTSGPLENYGLALHNDVLVVGGDGSTHIFSEQNGNWVETITLNQRHTFYALSGRQLLATTENWMYSFNIQDCA